MRGDFMNQVREIKDGQKVIHSDMFLENVQIDGKTVPRFKLID